MPGLLPPDPQTGSRLREARTRAGLTTYEVAGKVGVSQTLVSAWETGRSSPSSLHLRKLSELYSVSVDWLVGNDAREGMEADWPEGWSVLRRAADELTPEKRRAMVRVMQAMIDAEKEERERQEQAKPPVGARRGKKRSAPE